MSQRPGAVVMAVFRPDPVLLARQIASIRTQTCERWTCVIGVDGYDAEVTRLLQRLTSDDTRFRVEEHDANVGVYRHFERMLRSVPAEAAWVSLSDQDDYWYPAKLEKLTRELGRRGVAAVTGQARLVDIPGACHGVTRRNPGNAVETLLRNQVTGSLTVLRPEVVAAAVPFPDSTLTSMHDHWLGVCAAILGEVVLVDESVQDYVQHGANVLGEASATSVRAEVRAMRHHGGARGYLDHLARERWGWRVQMARTLCARELIGRHGPVLREIADEGAGANLLADLIRAVAHRRLRLRGAAATLVAAWWWRLRRG